MIWKSTTQLPFSPWLVCLERSRKWKTGRLSWNIFYLIAPDDVDDNKHVCSSDEPVRFLEGDEDVIIYIVPKHPVPNEGHREVAEGHD